MQDMSKHLLIHINLNYKTSYESRWDCRISPGKKQGHNIGYIHITSNEDQHLKSYLNHI